MSYLRKKYIQDSSDSDKNSDDEIEDIKKSSSKQAKQAKQTKQIKKVVSLDDEIEDIKKSSSKQIKQIKETKQTKETKQVKKVASSDDEDIKKSPSKQVKKVSKSKVEKSDNESDNESKQESDNESENSEYDKFSIPIKKTTNIEKSSDDKLLSEYNKILKKYWGYDGLKPTQFEVIKKVIVEKSDACAILATGFGKSLCYQLPHLITNKCVIVVSPLIALMHEQGQEMQNRKIPVAVFNSDTTKIKKEEMKKEILKNKNKLIYMTPEYLITAEDFIRELESKDNLAMVCIDEAHAVSTWGLDFRPGYTKLGVIRQWVPSVPILTLTATASTKVREDIVSILKLSEPELIVGNFDRPNLLIKVQERYDDVMLNISTLLNKYANEYIIIYCKTRDETDTLAEKINNLGINCASYHAGMADIERQSVQQDFIDGDIKCIIATIAFGMGINIPGVRLVIHYNCPKNIESYYQEIGRAGRDGKPSECVLFYSTKDFKINRFFLKSIQNPVQHLYQEKQIRCIEKYVYSGECRRKNILENFGQQIDSCTNCDNCLKKLKKEKAVDKADYTIPILMVLNILNKINDKFGQGMTIYILLAKKCKVKDWMVSYSEYGSGNEYGGETWWKTMLRNMINDDLIQENQVKGAFYSTMGLTSKGSSLRFKLMNKYPTYTDLTLVQTNDSNNKSYKELSIEYPIIPSDPVKKKVNKSTKTIKKDDKVILKKIAFEDKNIKQNKSTKFGKQSREIEDLDRDLDMDLDELIANSSNVIKRRLHVESDSE